MTQHDDGVYLGHMVDCSHQIEEMLRGLARVDFDENFALRLAVRHLIQTIGEAARRVSGEFQARHPQVPWREIIAMRNRIVHDYVDVNENVVWRVATQEVPALRLLVEPLVPEEFRTPRS
jgi:uncharacterized protein with HEPN domain